MEESNSEGRKLEGGHLNSNIKRSKWGFKKRYAK
jgi:hypothetical protein